MVGSTEQSYRFHLVRVMLARAHGYHEPFHPSPVNQPFYIWLTTAEGMLFAPTALHLEAFEVAEAIVKELCDLLAPIPPPLSEICAGQGTTMAVDVGSSPLLETMLLTHPCKSESVNEVDDMFAVNSILFGEMATVLDPYCGTHSEMGTMACCA
jgi:hypothetical protein